jgi:hypothetical protein
MTPTGYPECRRDHTWRLFLCGLLTDGKAVVSDDVPRLSRAAQIEAAIRHFHATFNEAGIDPEDRDDQRRFGTVFRASEEAELRRERRAEHLMKALGAILTAIAIGALTTGGPLLLRLLIRQ